MDVARLEEAGGRRAEPDARRRAIVDAAATDQRRGAVRHLHAQTRRRRHVALCHLEAAVRGEHARAAGGARLTECQVRQLCKGSRRLNGVRPRGSDDNGGVAARAAAATKVDWYLDRQRLAVRTWLDKDDVASLRGAQRGRDGGEVPADGGALVDHERRQRQRRVEERGRLQKREDVHDEVVGQRDWPLGRAEQQTEPRFERALLSALGCLGARQRRRDGQRRQRVRWRGGQRWCSWWFRRKVWC
mmetsp:Transcript_42724/g.93615  ORF Transcript_42724/g.93615 Transcript_42724/m.93615 type:complete len:245 (-) Transcript_42724:940-1674(-)